VLTGVALGIITMRFAAGIFVRLIEREPNLEAAAYLLVLAIGLELMAELFFHVHISHAMKFVISLSILVLAVLYGRVAILNRIGRRFRWIQRPLAWLSAGVRLLMRPIGWVVRGIFGVLKAAYGALAGRRGTPLAGVMSEPRSPGDHGGR
jgi:tellurite resistance protein TerC